VADVRLPARSSVRPVERRRGLTFRARLRGPLALFDQFDSILIKKVYVRQLIFYSEIGGHGRRRIGGNDGRVREGLTAVRAFRRVVH
jgi:hypothetical protein